MESPNSFGDAIYAAPSEAVCIQYHLLNYLLCLLCLAGRVAASRRVTDILGKRTETARTRRDSQLYESVGLRNGGHGGRVDHGERLGRGSVDALGA